LKSSYQHIAEIIHFLLFVIVISQVFAQPSAPSHQYNGLTILSVKNKNPNDLLHFLNNNGYPYAQIQLDSLSEYFFPTFNLLRVLPNKLLGVLSMAAVPAGLLTVPFIENVNKFQNPFRRPVAMTVFFVGTVFAIWFGFGAAMPIDKAVTLGFF